MKTKKFKVLLCLVCLLVPLLLPVEGLAKEIKSLVNEQKVIQEEYLPLPGNSTNPYGGTDYYIDATLGNDENTGNSKEQPWQNVTRANKVTFQAGDRILLKNGEEWQDQQLWPKGSGEEGKPITIDCYGDADLGRPYIATNGNVENPVNYVAGTFKKDKDKVGLTGAVVLRNQQYWEIHNLELSNDDDFNEDINVSAKIKSVVRDGISVSINADKFAPEETNRIMHGIKITNCYIHDIDGPTDWQQIHYGGIVFQVFGEKSYKEYDEGQYYFKDIVIENNLFKKTELHAIEFAFNWFYDRNYESGEYDETGKFHEGWEQLWVRNRDLYSRDVKITNNYCEDIGQGAIQLANTKDMVVEYNEVNGFLQRYHAVSCGLYLWAGADTVMQYNEVYDGPWDEYDGTPWDLEYTNFNVTYQYNYSHDNAAGWMAYMGNSSNSIARYNLSVNDNGVIMKNMLSTNYSPTFITNNIFVYDAEKMDWFHDEVFKDKVYFMNNVFYNTSTTTPTKWYRKNGALNHAVFSNNAFFETGGEHSPQEPNDPKKITANPQFVGNPLNYKQGNGVQNISNSAAIFKLKETSPLIDAGRYHRSLGTTDFFETQLYYGTAPDIGIHEYIQGEKVENPIDDQPIEIENHREKENIDYKKPNTANYTHPHNNYYYSADNLVDHDTTTRWAAPDPELMTEGYPIKIEIDFEKNTKFDEVYLDEFSDSGTNLRIQSFELQKLTRDGEWETFTKRDDGMGHDLTLNDFGEIESAKLRLLITSQKPTEYYTPSMTEIQVYSSNSQIGSEASISPHVFVYDQNPAMRQDSNNQIQFLVDVSDDEFTSIRYIGSEGNVLGSLNEGVDYQFDGQVMNISSTFLTSKEVGSAGLQFEFKSGKAIKTTMELTDTTMLCERINEGEKLSAKNDQLKQALIEAKTVLAKVNRETTAMGNDQVTHKEVVEAEMALAKAITESHNINDTSIQTNANPITNKQIKGHRLASQYTQLF